MNLNWCAPLSLIEPVLSLPEKILLAILFAVSLYLFFHFLNKKLKTIRQGGIDIPRTNRTGDRIRRVIRDVIFQYRVISGRPFVGTMHALLLFGFMAFLLEKLYHFPKAFGVSMPEPVSYFYRMYLGKFLFVVSLIVLFAVAAFMIRRGILRPKTLTRSPDAWMVLSLVAIIMVTFLVPFFSGSQLLVNGAHWLQNLTILFFLVYIPRSKHLHLLFCPVNEYLRNFDRAQLRTLDFSDEQKEDFGIGQVGKFSWKDMFDSYTCIHCGRCNDACPAMVSGKSLQPREVVLGLQHAIEDQKLDQPAVDTVIDEKSLWQCTTCAACEERCPVGIEHPGKIIGVRRYRVQAETACPAEAQNIFKWLERSKNTFGIDPVEREKTISSLKIPAYEKGTQHLLWLGCFAAFDQGYRKSLGSFISILKAAGISYGVMPGEICCGDPARRLGNEFLYQEMAQSTVEHLRELDVKKVISMCPHCCVTLGRDYGDLGMNLEVTHHSVFINELISKKSISFSGVSSGSVVFHDPCYLSRYLGVVKEPGSALSAAGFSVIDPPRAGEQTFCCGGGGGQVFLEEHDGERISNLRFKELNATGAKAVAVGCPYCHTMLKDARATLGADSAMAFGDIADFVVQNMTSSSPKAS